MSEQSKRIIDPGFGKSNTSFGRLVNQDGSFNVVRKGVGIFQSQKTYNWLLTISWVDFLLIAFGLFLFGNSVFALAYFFCGPMAINLSPDIGVKEHFLQSLYFSVQTSSTIGYGGLSPVGMAANLIVILESFVGVIMVALTTGVVFARFSRPVSSIISSDNFLLAPYKDGSAFMFRIANSAKHQIIELQARVFLSKVEFVDGEKSRQYYRLDIERDSVSALPLSWTIVHPITPESPLFGYGQKELEDSRAEILVTLIGMDETFNQTVYTRTSYRAGELVTGASFVPMFHRSDDGSHTILDLSKLNDYESAILPISSESSSEKRN